jgi:hypothetical protein
VTSATKYSRPAITSWRVRIRFKLYRVNGNTKGKFLVGIAYTSGPNVMSLSTDGPIIDLTNYAVDQWHDIELYAQPSGQSASGVVVAGLRITEVLAGAAAYVADLQVDEVGISQGVPQKTASAAYTLQITDNGKHIYISTGGVTIPNNADIAFPVEASVTIVNNSGSTQTIGKGGSVTLYLSGSGSKTSLTLAAYGICTVLKVGTDTWYATGSVT